jgi:GMP synthase (glutamine-hydrolysing)
MNHLELVLILDFGSQYTQLIARRVRECGVYSEIHPYNLPFEKIQTLNPAAIILSGGPSSVYEDNAPIPDDRIFSLQKPLLGICYGLQVIAYKLGGEVDRSAKREYGRAEISVVKGSPLLEAGHRPMTVWMSHGDALRSLPGYFDVLAHSSNSPFCVIGNTEKRIYGVQFHPEVVHTVGGREILHNFLYNVAGCKGGWNAGSFVEQAVTNIRKEVGDERVILALSGGVDSSVTAVLLHKAIGDKLYCFHVDTGLMRKEESREVVKVFRDHYKMNLDFVDASGTFLGKLEGVDDPEVKRKIIGTTFIEIFEQEAQKLGNIGYLAQGTLYPDVIESVSFKGPSHTIKTHHNVGGLPERMNLKLIEPLRELFKDEVRKVGTELGLPGRFLNRHPFPGPGLAVRILGPVTRENVKLLQEADAIFTEELEKSGLYDQVWQAFTVLLPVRSVGVMGDQRTYEQVAALRAVTSVDGMTADFAELPHDLLGRVSTRIINEVRGINRVVYDVSSKPPATIEWE